VPVTEPTTKNPGAQPPDSTASTIPAGQETTSTSTSTPTSEATTSPAPGEDPPLNPPTVNPEDD